MQQELNTTIKQWGKRIILSTLTSAKSFGVPTPTAHSLKLMNIGFEDTSVPQGLSICPYKYGHPAAACISIDFEHLPDNPGPNSLNSRGTRAVLKLAEQFGIPLTWAVCGEAAVRDREAYEQILRSKVKHDIGVHTYGHLDVTDPTYTELDILDDLSKCIKVLDIRERPVSFVFPYNREGHFDFLRRLGFIVYRCKERIFSYPERKNGLWCIPPTYYMHEKSVGDLNLIKKMIDFSIAHGSVSHIWLHPRNISINGDFEAYSETVLKPVLQYMYEKRREGKLWICTMRELANYCEARDNCTITSKSQEGKIKLYARCILEYPRFDYPPQVTLKIPLPQGGAIVRVKGEPSSNTKVSGSKDDLYLYLTLTFEEPVRYVEISSPSLKRLAP